MVKKLHKGNEGNETFWDKVMDAMSEDSYRSSVQTKFITVSSLPNKVDIYLQPPRIVYVQKVFQSIAKLTISTGSPTPDQQVKAAVIQSIKDLSELNDETINTLMTNLGQQKTDLEDMKMIN